MEQTKRKLTCKQQQEANMLACRMIGKHVLDQKLAKISIEDVINAILVGSDRKVLGRCTRCGKTMTVGRMRRAVREGR